MKTLDLGCGNNKTPGAIGMDHHPGSAADVLADIEHGYFPFADESFEHIECSHVIEHVRNPVRLMEECRRFLKSGGTLRVKTPHHTHWTSWGDPTHFHHFSSHALLHFTQPKSTAFYRCRYSLAGMHRRCSAFPARFLQAILESYRHERYCSRMFPIRKIIAEFKKETLA